MGEAVLLTSAARLPEEGIQSERRFMSNAEQGHSQTAAEDRFWMLVALVALVALGAGAVPLIAP